MDARLICSILLLSATTGGASEDGWSMTVQAEVRAMEGHPVVLPCSFSHPQHAAHAALAVTWRLGHAPLFHCTSQQGAVSRCQPGPLQDPRYRLEGEPRQHDLSLRITSAALQDGGRYYCRLELLGHGHTGYEDKMGTRLTVEAAPRILGLSVEGDVESGYTAVCRVQGSPLPDVQWFGPDREGGAAPDPPAQAVLYQALSRLAGVLPGQHYTCSASNLLGRQQAALYLLQAPPPAPPHPTSLPPILLLLLAVALGTKALLLGGVATWAVLCSAPPTPR